MIRVGTLDHPVARSSHTVPTPKGGGVGIVAAAALGMAWQAGASHLPLMPLAAAVVFLATFSYLDDLYDWRFAAKLAAQAAASGVIILSGCVAHAVWLPGLGPVELGPAGWALTLCWLLFVTNAVNFMDGLNGLAAGSAAIACLGFAAATPAGVIALPLVAGIVGFLPFNYPQARIFMGDVGSQACGLLVAALAVFAAAQPDASVVIPYALLPLLADVAFTLLRRAHRGERITQAHRGHLYQVAHRAGVPAWRVALAYWGMATWGAAVGIAAGELHQGRWPLLISAIFTLGPFVAWAAYITRRAARAGLTVW
jgi:UDP-GlcNAc:undecaprenyl-phosphate GlcNAc-1-phosphate transferase